jgi:hypothetical protein
LQGQHERQFVARRILEQRFDFPDQPAGRHPRPVSVKTSGQPLQHGTTGRIGFGGHRRAPGGQGGFRPFEGLPPSERGEPSRGIGSAKVGDQGGNDLLDLHGGLPTVPVFALRFKFPQANRNSPIRKIAEFSLDQPLQLW